MATAPTDLRPLFHHCLSVEESGRGLVPVRFTENQFRAYKIEEARHLRARCAAGVTLEWVGDPTSLRLDYEILGKVREWAHFDLFINGVLVDRQGSEAAAMGPGQVAFTFPGAKGPMHFALCLPHNIEIAVRDLDMGGASWSPAPAPAKKLLALGDSITQGMEAHFPSSPYAFILARHLGYDLLNQGVGGHIFDPLAVDGEMAWKPDLITVAYGTNDWGRYPTPEAMEGPCLGFFKALFEAWPKTPVVVLTPLWRKDHGTPKPFGSFDLLQEKIKAWSQVHGRPKVLDGRDLMPNMPESFADGLHPTDGGFRDYALAMIKAFREIGT